MARRTKGEGTLYQAADKSWVFQYRVDGQRKTKRFKKKAEAKAFQDALFNQAAEEQNGQSTDVITLGEWMDRWLESYAKPTVKLSTYCSYEQYIRGHIRPQIGMLYMNTLKVDDLQEFFNERGERGNIKEGRGLSPKTLTNLRNMMHLALGQAVKNGLLKMNPVEGVRLPRMVQQEMRVLSRTEQDRLIKAARRGYRQRSRRPRRGRLSPWWKSGPAPGETDGTPRACSPRAANCKSG